MEYSILMDRINHLLKLFDLVPYQEQMIETYSQGMQRKVSMCLALLNDPELLIVDELTNAYDAKTIAVIKKIFRERKAVGKTVLFSGHVMAVMEELSDYIVIIQKGICYASGTMAELTAQYGNNNLEDLFLQLTDAQINDQVG
ncbi:MAG: ATP-binding cassette domain-containing protein [Syntrophomonas sp.]|nr:ATP-binding cassette domain-containing protein [Syntrophomonas sp.]